MSKHSNRHQKARMVRAAAAKTENASVAITMPLVLAIAGDGSKPRRFEGTLYNGGPLKVDAYPLPIAFDLAGMEGLEKPRPITREHEDARLVGHMDHYVNDGRSLVVAGVVSAEGQDAAEVVAMHDRQFPWQLSIEALPYKADLQVIPAGRTVQVNGQMLAGPIFLARRAKFVGASVVSRGADDESSFRIAASAAQRKEFDMEFAEWVKATLGLDVATLTDQQKALVKAAHEKDLALVKASVKPGEKLPIVPPEFDLSAIVAAHEKHTALVTAKAEAYKGKIDPGPLAEIQAKAAQDAAMVKAKALQDEWPALRLEVALADVHRETELALVRAERPKGPAIHTPERDVTAPMVEAAMCRSINLPDYEKSFKPEVLEAAHHRWPSGVGLQEVLVRAARQNGYQRDVFRINDSNLRQVLQYAFPPFALPVHASGTSTVSLPGIFSNVANKSLLLGFNDVEQVWREISVIGSASDFKTMTRYRMLDDMVYEKLTPVGEINHGEVDEESYTVSVDTYAKMFALTRKDIINDDMGAFDSIRSRLGRGSGLKINQLFWAEFLDDAAFFTAGRGNLISAVLGLAGLAAGELALDALTDGKGNPIDVQASILLTGSTLEPTARTLYTSQEIRDTSSNKTYTTANIYVNKYRPLKSKYIKATYGGTATAWWLLPIPSGDMAPMEACFLNSQQAPTVESADADFNQLGVQFRGYHDFGMAKKEWRAGIKSTGLGG